jgi:hypothetical protein
LERGSILFLYRPHRDVTHVQGADDLERLYLMLIPDDREEHKSRIYSLSSRALPVLIPGRAAPEERTSALAEEVDPDPRVALDRLQEEAATRAPGRHPRPWVRAAGEGRYAVFRHGADTHLAYVLDRPRQPGEVQKALRIGPQGQYLISVKALAAPSEVAPGKRPSYPPRLESRFRGYERIPVDPSDYLDYPNTLIFLLAADADARQELGLGLEPGAQNQGQRQALQVLHKEERRAAQEGVALLEPLQEGHWA